MKSKFITFVLFSLFVILVVGCSDDDTSPTAPQPVTPSQNFMNIFNAFNSFIDTASFVMTATQLEPVLNDTNYVVLDVRDSAVYRGNPTANPPYGGHIPGAHLLWWKSVANPNYESLLNTWTRNKTKRLVVYCFTGHTGGLATAALGALGYNVVNFKYGMSGWTDDNNANGLNFTGHYTSTSAINGTVDTVAYALEDYNAYPEPSSGDVRTALNNYLSTATAVISAAAVRDSLNAGANIFILDVRQATDYAAGHIPTARNVFVRDLNDVATLRKLPSNRLIVIYCYTGHSGAYATTYLNALGYRAVNMKFGYAGWQQNANYFNPPRTFRNVTYGDNP
ncbi:MAG: rhodanese-like domain-containing protein [bacterium]|nr:rhodanese-like domain-containing protein [bacterium]